MWWPGDVYDGDEAMQQYAEGVRRKAKGESMDVRLREQPIFSHEEADAWLAEAQAGPTDGLLVILLDRQRHAWPTARKAILSGLPAVVFSPLGSSFTTNTIGLADAPNSVIISASEVTELQKGMQMLAARAKMHHARALVIAGNAERETPLADTGITLQYCPASLFIETYQSTPEDDELLGMADAYIRQSRGMTGATRQDVINGIRSYKVAGKLLEKYRADAISMDCLGALADQPISLPCIAWSRMNDDAIPAACEADTGAIAAQVMVHYLLGRPGFQQDPVADTSDDTLIGAHCSSPTRLSGFDEDPEPFHLQHHHGNRDAVPVPKWKVGQRMTCFDLFPGAGEEGRSRMLLSAGTVVDNMSVPPHGGCVVSVKARMDGNQPVLTYPGFHQLFFYGDAVREMKAFGQLCGFEAEVVG